MQTSERGTVARDASARRPGALWEEGILTWCGLALGAYLVKILCFGFSTMLSHYAAYHILEGLRLRVAVLRWGHPHSLPEHDGKFAGAVVPHPSGDLHHAEVL